MKQLLIILALTVLGQSAVAGFFHPDPDGDGSNRGPGYPEVAQMGQVLELSKSLSDASSEISKLSASGSPEGDEEAALALKHNQELSVRAVNFLDVVEDEQDTPQNTAAAELDLKQAFETAVKTKDKIKLEGEALKQYQAEFAKTDEVMSEIAKYYK